ncbi:hypothetical protein [Burkholderia sp. RS02]|uniref:hypothetical protein n=1 Tax=unclassified Burkholderia TaxID=2613784 RepID=UPI003218CFF9
MPLPALPAARNHAFIFEASDSAALTFIKRRRGSDCPSKKTTAPPGLPGGAVDDAQRPLFALGDFDDDFQCMGIGRARERGDAPLR